MAGSSTIPSREILPALIAALEREQSEFVRPALTRALAASQADPAVQKALEPLIMRGEDYFRGSLIEALGDYQAAWAREPSPKSPCLPGRYRMTRLWRLRKIEAVSRYPCSPLCRKPRAMRHSRPLAVATCLITKDCAAHLDYLTKTLTFAAARPKTPGVASQCVVRSWSSGQARRQASAEYAL